MSHLGTLVRHLSLLAGFASTDLACAKKETPLPPCQEMNYSEQQLTAAFNSAAEKLKSDGYEVRSNLWEDEGRFTRLVDGMTNTLGCSLDSPAYQALRQESSCNKVKVSPPYNTSIRYCGPGAVSGTDFCWRLHPGDCMNTICYTHDLCYDNLLSASEESGICAWSEETAGCDDNFFTGFVSCGGEEKCGFGCHLIAAIATGLIAAENAYNRGSGCLIYENSSCCADPDGGTNTSCPAGATWADLGNGVIQDCEQQNIYWQQTRAPQPLTWPEADAYCRNLELGGLTGWRLPTEDEFQPLLQQFFEKGGGTLCCPVAPFEVAPSTGSCGNYWSADNWWEDPQYKTIVGFATCSSDLGVTTQHYNVRCLQKE